MYSILFIIAGVMSVPSAPEIELVYMDAVRQMVQLRLSSNCIHDRSTQVLQLTLFLRERAEFALVLNEALSTQPLSLPGTVLVCLVQSYSTSQFTRIVYNE